MKPIIYTLAVILGLGTGSTIQAIQTENIEANSSNNQTAKPSSNSQSIDYAYYYTDQTQLGIGPNHIVELTNLGMNNNRRFELSSNGGFTVPNSGNYLISYRVLSSSQASLALFKNGVIMPSTAFSNTSSSPIFGSAIIAIKRRDVITIQSIETAKVFNTVVSVSTVTPPLAVSLTVQSLN